MHPDILFRLVLPEPAMDSGRRRSERAVQAVPTDFVVQQIAFEISGLRLLVWLAVELELNRSVRLPRIDERRALLNVILDLEPFARMQTDILRCRP